MNLAKHPDRNQIKKHQLSRIRNLLRALVPHNPFYSRKLEGTGITSALESLEEFSQGMPFTEREELVEDQETHPPYGSNLTYPLEVYTRMHQTSGTARTPLRWLDTPESWNWMLDNWERVYEAAGVSDRDRIFFPFSFGPFVGFWAAFEAGTRRGALCIPGGGLSSVARLHTIRDNRISVLCCTPTYALHLAEIGARENMDFQACPIRLVIVGGEPGGSIASTRRRIEARWKGARLVDHHGMTEIGPVSYECPRRPRVLHVIESSFYAEVLNPENDKPVADGQVGELVLTNLGRLGSPLLRYRSGDLVKPERGEPCACGSYELALLDGILGRLDDMVVVRGVNLFPSAVEQIVRSLEEVSEYRVEIGRRGALPEVSLRIEPSPRCKNSTQLAERLEAELRTHLLLRIPVSIAAPGSLPRFELKAARWVKGRTEGTSTEGTE